MISVIPFKSTYVRYVSTVSPGLTPGQIYRVSKWEEGEFSYGTHCFTVRDDRRSIRRMVAPREDFEDYSFIRNLKEILE